MDPSLKGKASAGAGAVDFGKASLHANNLQEQLKRSTMRVLPRLRILIKYEKAEP
jgi:hypothetical protein